MPGIEHKDHDELTLLEVMLRSHGDFRRRLEPIGVTPLQTGAILYLHRHGGAKVTEAAATLRVRLPTLVAVIQALVCTRWVAKQRLIHDRRAVCLRLSRQGTALALQIEQRVKGRST